MEKIAIFSEHDLRLIVSDEIKNVLDKLVQKDTKPLDELISRKETAKLLGISLPTLSTYSKDGKIQSYRIGTRIRYKQSEVLESLTKIQSFKYH